MLKIGKYAKKIRNKNVSISFVFIIKTNLYGSDFEYYAAS